MSSTATRLLCGLVALLLIPGVAQAQQGTITGKVTDAQSGNPLPGASILVVETGVGTAADVNGKYSITGVEPGTKTLRVSFVGYSSATREVTVEAGETVTANFQLKRTAKQIEEVVVTGVAQETQQANLSFSVSTVSSQDLQKVTASSPVQALQGKVAGLSVGTTSGEPGSGLSVNLRATNTLTGSNSPLYIVDGVILGASQVDLGSMSIKSIEVVKGAAASSLYGSRAQNGVIKITTKSGQGIPLGNTRVTFRSEVGIQSLGDNLVTNRSHAFKTNDKGQFVNQDGEPINYGQGIVPRHAGPHNTRFWDTPYSQARKVNGEPYKLYQPFNQFFKPGNTYTNYIAISQNSQSTNFRISYEDQREGGVIAPGPDGKRRDYIRKRFRVNLDHRPNEDVSVSASAFYADITSNRLNTTDFNPFFDLMFQNPLSNLTEKDKQGELVIKPDPRAVESNPLYPVENAKVDNNRSRFLGNFQATYTPMDWLTLEGNLSYDRLDRVENEFYKRGFKTRDPSSYNEGQIEEYRVTDEALNYSGTISFAKSFGDLTTRSQLKYQVESQNYHSFFAQGSDFATVGIPNFENIADQQSKDISSTRRTIRSESFYGTASFNYDDRYIADFLVRRDGSSLFGAKQRWQTYYRASGAYRISEEPFWPFPDAVNQLKLRYSYGTAGARPDFSAQYETYSINDGNVSKSTLGNAQLKPEFQIEQEFGIDLGFYNRVFLTVNYVDTRVENQLLQVPLSAPLGFSTQWQNAGTVASNTLEASLDATVLRTQNVSWDLGVTFDATNQKIVEFERPAYRTGPASLFYYRDDEILGAMYGAKFVTSKSQLQVMGLDPSKFQKNNQGYMVPVGQGKSWKDGFNAQACSGDGCWGTSVNVSPRKGLKMDKLSWGIPFKFVDKEGDTFHQIGSSVPDFNLNFNSNFSFLGFSAYALVSYQHGGDVYNQTKQWSYRDARHSDYDQHGRPQQLKKPDSYYRALYNKNANTSHFVEDATFLKLREVSIGYEFDEAQLNNLFGAANPLHTLSIDVTGRNLLTFTDYSGFDPEIGGGENPNLFAVDNFQYPPFRTITGRIEIQF